MRHPLPFSLASILILSAIGSAGSQELMSFPDAQQEAIGDVLRANGLNCPAAKMAWAHGPGPRGDVIQVRCGPDDGTGDVYSDFSYRIVFHPDDTLSVEPWE